MTDSTGYILISDPEKVCRQKKLEGLLLEALESGEPTPLTKKDFDDIKARGIERLRRNEVSA